TVTLIPNGIHHPPIEDGRLLPNSVKAPEHDHPCRLFLHIRFFDCFCHIDQEFYSFDEPI
ncbi:hypothetical protein, partial [Enterococcus faecium]|uniref:hypothetical protein n=1 Tax=Enterococcus faecium TaxID=1352 RepID=UPI002D7A259C